jgi:hypothetical protein
MANTNILTSTSIFGKTATLNVTTTMANVVANLGNSNKLFKVNSLYVSNLNASNIANVSIAFNRGSTASYLARFIDVPNKSTFTAIDKNTVVFLEEGDTIQLVANTTGDLQAVCSYEEIG